MKINLRELDTARGPLCIVSEENQEVKIEMYELRFAEKSDSNVKSRWQITKEAGMILITAQATKSLSSGMRVTNGLFSLAGSFCYTKRSLTRLNKGPIFGLDVLSTGLSCRGLPG